MSAPSSKTEALAARSEWPALDTIVACSVLLGALGYAVTVLCAAAITPGYSHSTQLISELGQVGAPAADAMRAMLVCVGVLVIAFAHELRRGSEPALASHAGCVLLAILGLGLLLGGVFQCDPQCGPVTFAGWAHILTSIPATLASLIGPFVFAVRMKERSGWAARARWNRFLGIASIAALLAALTVFPAFGCQGVGQRIATLLPLVWVASLAWARVSPIAAATDRFPKGPSGLAALRYLGLRRRLLDLVERCQREYGGIVGMRLFGAKICVVSDPELTNRLLVQHAPRLRQWDLGQFELVLGRGLLTSEGALWRRQRRTVQPFFSPTRLSAYDGLIVRHAEAMLEQWNDGAERELLEDSMRVSRRIAGSILFGEDSRVVEEAVEDTLDRLMLHFERAMTGLPIPLSIPTPANLRTRSSIRRLDDAIMKLITARRRAGIHGEDFLGTLLRACEDAETQMDDRQVRDECVTMLLAAHETTALVLTWTLHLLTLNREHAHKLALAVDGVVGADTTPNGGHLAQIPELTNVIRESMRLYTPVWAFARVNNEACDLGEVHLPAGTQIFFVPHLTHRSHATFDAPTEFRPERWSTADSDELSRMRAAYLPFGTGPRKCVGMHLAMHQLGLVLLCILRRFEITAVAGHENPPLQASVTLRPRDGIRARVHRRAAVMAELPRLLPPASPGCPYAAAFGR